MEDVGPEYPMLLALLGGEDGRPYLATQLDAQPIRIRKNGGRGWGTRMIGNMVTCGNLVRIVWMMHQRRGIRDSAPTFVKFFLALNRQCLCGAERFASDIAAKVVVRYLQQRFEFVIKVKSATKRERCRPARIHILSPATKVDI